MVRFILKKTIYGALVMAGVVTVVFFLFQGLGDPARLIVGQTGDVATLVSIRRDLSLDKPVLVQFVHYIRDISPVSIHTEDEIRSKELHGFFLGGHTKLAFKVPYLRRSYQSKQKVSAILLDAFPGTAILALTAILMATVIGVFLGTIAALNKGTWLDTSTLIASVAGISAPSFFTGILIAWTFGFLLHDWTGLYMTGSLFDVDIYEGNQPRVENLLLPAITLGIRPLAIIVQIMRGAMLDVLSQDFIRTARAKGIAYPAVVLRHALPNAVNPVITAITGWFAELLAGAFFVEYIFGWKGVGKITVDALEKLDYPVVMGSLLMTASLFIVINIFADLLYSKLDPRVDLV